MVNFDNIYLVILYAVFGFPSAVVRFIFLNILALFNIDGYPKTKKLWTKDELLKIFIHPYNLLIGVIIFIIFLIVYQ